MEFPFEKCCSIEGCRNIPVTFALGVKDRRGEIERRYCFEHGSRFLAEYDSQRQVFGVTGRMEHEEFDIDLVVLDGNKDWYPVYLREVKGDERCVRLYAGVFEASALYYCFKPAESTHQMTHEIIPVLIETLGGNLRDVLIYGLTPIERVYKAYLRVCQADRVYCIDVRPSDAINVAVLAGVSIYISEDVLAATARDLA
jgi:bifunctional DNase/RNase